MPIYCVRMRRISERILNGMKKGKVSKWRHYRNCGCREKYIRRDWIKTVNSVLNAESSRKYIATDRGIDTRGNSKEIRLNEKCMYGVRIMDREKRVLETETCFGTRYTLYNTQLFLDEWMNGWRVEGRKERRKEGITATTTTTGDRDSSVGIATRYGLEGPGIESRWGRDFSHPFRPALDAPNLLYTGYRVFLGRKAAGVWRWTPTPSSAEVKERVVLYLISPSEPSRPVLGWPLLLPLYQLQLLPLQLTAWRQICLYKLTVSRLLKRPSL
jgi:hypothetical protein